MQHGESHRAGIAWKYWHVITDRVFVPSNPFPPFTYESNTKYNGIPDLLKFSF